MRAFLASLVVGMLAAPLASSAIAATDEAPHGIRWMSTGDSYSSGEGIPGNEGACAHSSRAWGPEAVRLLRDDHGWGIDDPVVFTACTRHLIDDFYIRNDRSLLETLTFKDGKGSFWEWAQEQADTDAPKFDVITLTFGGNDLEFSDILLDCWSYVETGTSWTDLLRTRLGDTGCDVSEEELVEQVDAFADASRFEFDRDPSLGGSFGSRTGNLADFYATLVERHLTDRGKLVVMGYPRLFAPSAEWKWWYGRRCAGFYRQDTNMLGRVAEHLDEVIHRQVDAANGKLAADRVMYVSALDLYGGPENDRRAEKGHELCGNADDWLNGWWLDGTGKRLDASFHPHEKGHRAQAEAVAARLGEIEWPSPLTGISDSPPEPGCRIHRLDGVRVDRDGFYPHGLRIVLLSDNPDTGSGLTHPSHIPNLRVTVPTATASGKEALELLRDWGGPGMGLWVCWESPGTIRRIVAAEPDSLESSQSANAETLAGSAWEPFGEVSLLEGGSAGSFVVEFDGTYWGGVVASGVQVCDYRLEGSARLIRGSGYGFAVGGRVSDGIPHGKGIQYDPGIGGYRDVSYPEESETGRVIAASLDNHWHEISIEIARGLYVSKVDGETVFAGSTSVSCGSPLIRVWRSAVEIRDVRLVPLQDSDR